MQWQTAPSGQMARTLPPVAPGDPPRPTAQQGSPRARYGLPDALRCSRRGPPGATGRSASSRRHRRANRSTSSAPGDRRRGLRAAPQNPRRARRHRLVEPRCLGCPHIVGKGAAERDDVADHLWRLECEIAGIDATEAPLAARISSGESRRLALSSNRPRASASSRPRPGGRSRPEPGASSRAIGIYFFLSLLRVPPRPAMVTNMS